MSLTSCHAIKASRLSLTFLFFLLACTLAGSEFPAPYNSEPDRGLPLPPDEAAARMKLPAGFKATVLAAEPDVQNPIAMAWDGRGRLWVAENYTYAERGLKFDLRLRDRVVIFEDKDGKGRFDERKVFTDELQMLTSLEVGNGGVYLMCPPRLLFIPDTNGDDQPDAPPQVLLDGFTVPSENYHNFANGLRFGPDGWLYGRCGASSPGQIGPPGTPPEDRIPMRGTLWRYHPRRRVFESLTCGTTNPWGHDWNEHGELFFINTVNGHLWHEIPGAHFVRPHTIDPNPRVYGLIDQHADHWHFDTAEGWGKSRDGKADAYGGGHAHVGMMIYLGDNWPAEYRGRLFTINMHGRRANQEILERTGSGYIGRHGQDFFLAADPWFRGMELSYGPDGAVVLLDWSDTGECHESTGVHRSSGRIYKIVYGEERSPLPRPDLGALPPARLVELQRHHNEWFARRARLELGRRAMGSGPASAGSGAAPDKADLASAGRDLREMFQQSDDVVVKLRALWCLYAIGAAPLEFLEGQLQHTNEHVRAWAIRLISDSWPIDTVMSKRPKAPPDGASAGTSSPSTSAKFVHLAKTDPSGLVRLVLASTLQRLPVSARIGLATALSSRREDAQDHNLPMLIWYGLIPVADSEPAALATLASGCELPVTRKFIARRLAEEIDKNPTPLNHLLQLTSGKSETFQADVLEGMAQALAGWRKAPKPQTWDRFAQGIAQSAEAGLRERVRNLSVLFGDGRALEDVRKVVLDENAEVAARKSALQTLIESDAPGAREICERLISIQFVNSVAAAGLARFNDPAVGATLVRAYRQFHLSERPQVLAILASRPAYAPALLEAIAEGRIARSDLSVFQARQMRSFKDPVISARLAQVWGDLREGAGDNAELLAKWKSRLTPVMLGKADLSRGRAMFNLACASCHTLYGEGGKLGPDLTGAGRDNLDYLLENVVDPGAVVSADFRMSIVKLKDGRVLNGLITGKTDRTITIRTATETLTIEGREVEKVEGTALSLMPDGLLDSLTVEQARDLIGYLMHPAQVPLPR